MDNATHEQLYYPNLNPKITSKLAISLLHWDKLVRIYPADAQDIYLPEDGILHDLVVEGILDYVEADADDIDKATLWLEHLIRIASDMRELRRPIAGTLISTVPTRFVGVNNYVIYDGKLGNRLREDYPKYFRRSHDNYGNVVYVCSTKTGITYMTLLAYFLNRRKGYSTSITDYDSAFPLFIALDKMLHFTTDGGITDFVPAVEAAKQVERIFYIPLLRILEPRQFEGERTIEKVLAFRNNKLNEELRKKYLARINEFLSELKKCDNDTMVKEIVHEYEHKFQIELQVLVDACGSQGIPVNRKVISHGSTSGWVATQRLWEATSKVIDVVTFSALSVVKPLLRLKPSLDYYESVLMNKDYFYPLLIQETFAPSITQRIFRRLQRLDEIQL